jgi:hypothetical protein
MRTALEPGRANQFLRLDPKPAGRGRRLAGEDVPTRYEFGFVLPNRFCRVRVAT